MTAFLKATFSWCPCHFSPEQYNSCLGTNSALSHRHIDWLILMQEVSFRCCWVTVYDKTNHNDLAANNSFCWCVRGVFDRRILELFIYTSIKVILFSQCELIFNSNTSHWINVQIKMLKTSTTAKRKKPLCTTLSNIWLKFIYLKRIYHTFP